MITGIMDENETGISLSCLMRKSLPGEEFDIQLFAHIQRVRTDVRFLRAGA